VESNKRFRINRIFCQSERSLSDKFVGDPEQEKAIPLDQPSRDRDGRKEIGETGMLFIVSGLALIILLIRAFVGITEARDRWRRFETEVETTDPVVNNPLSTGHPLPTESMREPANTLEATSLTVSLLSAAKVHSQRQHNSVEVTSAETNASVE
jgi:hypothetical protein